MPTNIGTVDRVLRLVVAAILFYLVFGTATLGAGVLYWLALIVAIIFTLTAIVGSCPLYRIFGIKTCKVR